MKRALFLLVAIFTFGTLQAQTNWTTYYEASGFLKTPRYDATIEYCKLLDMGSNMIHYTTFGVSPQGRNLPLVILDKDGLISPEEIREKGRIILMVECCIHPGESEGKDAMLMLLRDFAIYGEQEELLDDVSLMVIPIFNVDGHERFSPYNRINQNGPKEMGWRVTAQNYNLNRDFLKADAPEMKAWLQLYNQWLPEFFIDCHTTDGADYQYVITYALETFGNMDKDITRWVKNTYEPEITEKMFAKNFPIFRYVSFRQWHNPKSGLYSHASPPMLSQGYTAIRNRPGLLIETHMLKPYKPRVESTYHMVLETMQILQKEKSNLVKAIQKADQHCISGDIAKKPLPVKFNTNMNDSTMVDFLGVEYTMHNSDITSGVWYKYDSTKPVTFQLPMFEKPIIAETVKLPNAYIIPVEWTEIIERIQAHGIAYNVIREDTEYEVTSYRFSNPQWSNRPYENHMQLQRYDMEEITEKRVYPAGSILIHTNQQAARAIAHILEPKASDSYLSWGFFNSVFEQKEYSETYVMEPMAKKMLEENPDIKAAFDKKVKENPDWLKNQWGVMNWFYHQTPWGDPKYMVYPVGKIN